MRTRARRALSPARTSARTPPRCGPRFRNVSFELTSRVHAGDDLFAAQWTMRGTNSGPFVGPPPTGRSACVKGADFIRVGEDGIRSVEGYFSPGDLPAQIGMQVVVQPNEIGPFMFGTSTRVGPTWSESRAPSASGA